jgi:hypothetical protein
MPIVNAVDRVGGASRPQGLLRSPSGEATEKMLKQLSMLRPEVRRRIYQQPNPSQRWPRLGLAKLLNSPYNEVLAVAGAGSEFCDCQPVPAIRKKSRKAEMWFNRGLVTAAILLLVMPASIAQPLPTVGPKAAASQWAGSVSAASPDCWWRRGQRSCRAYGPARGLNGRSDYFEYDANTLPFGTERWRHQMRRENRLGNPG